MHTKPRRESAVITPFPPGGRAALERGARPTSAATVVTIPSGRGWYHDVAIRDARDAADRKPRA